MPKMDGLTFIKTLRNADYNQPVLIITARDSYDDMEIGFKSGTDDYMVKPINVNEMVLRVGALLKRAKINNERKLTIGNTLLEYDSLTVKDGTKEEALPQRNLCFFLNLYLHQTIFSPVSSLWTKSGEWIPKVICVPLTYI